jgi:hypothetical protein
MTVQNMSLSLFAIAIVLSFKLSQSVSIDQQARNQAQALESHFEEQTESQRLLDSKDSDYLRDIRQALDFAS